jgi:cellulose synthase/poly-beta-1,6-N-acetylglucosamine synthase-like glycosyltransferase
MMITVNVVLLALAIALTIPALLFCLEVLLSLLPFQRPLIPQWPLCARLAVLIPAHNEQSVIAKTLQTLGSTLPSCSRVIVVADNCSDSTQAIAEEHGAEVVQRTDNQRRGKGFALDAGIRHLSRNPPDVVVFLDADCRVAGDTVRLLAAAALSTKRPVQGLNLCDPDPRGSVLQKVSGLAFRFKNLVRTLGLVRLAGLSHLTGTGMALPWPLVAQSKLADGNVVEDMQLGIDLALAGHPPMFVPDARIDSPLPQERSAARTQRTRWEHGHLATLLCQSPRLVWLAVRYRRLDLVWLAIDLAVPPLSLLILALALSAIVSAVGWLLGASVMPLCIVASALLLVAAAVLLGWGRHCREQVPLSALVAAPFYAITKLPIYLSFVVSRQKQWVRTERM